MKQELMNSSRLELEKQLLESLHSIELNIQPIKMSVDSKSLISTTFENLTLNLKDISLFLRR